MPSQTATNEAPRPAEFPSSSGQQHAAADPPRLNRNLPPELGLLDALLRLRVAAPEARKAWWRIVLALADPPFDEDRPALRAWLQLSLGEAAVPLEEEECEPPVTLSRRDVDRQEEADHLHRLVRRLDGQARRQRRLLEQELLLRSSLPEDWYFHRAKWCYLSAQQEQTGVLLSPADAARRARAMGVHFHPDQLRESPLRGWATLRQALDMLDSTTWLRLLRHLRTGRPLDLVLPPGLWSKLRPWLSFLLGGSGFAFLEHYAGSLPDTLPDCAVPGGLLVLHADGPLEGQAESWARAACERGWQLVAVRAVGGPGPAFLNRLEAGHQALDFVRRSLLASRAEGNHLPLKDFVRQMERHYILDVLGQHKGVKSRACERLRISRQTLYAKLGAAEGGAA